MDKRLAQTHRRQLGKDSKIAQEACGERHSVQHSIHLWLCLKAVVAKEGRVGDSRETLTTYQDRPAVLAARALAWKASTSGAGLPAGADLSAADFGEWAAQGWADRDLLATAFLF